jgi:hypothetical protein
VRGLPLVSATVWLVSSVTSPAGALLLLLPALLLSPSMSSSPPTESSWDLLFFSTTASSSAMSSVVPSPAPLQVSGEFNAFVQLGSAVSGRGGCKAFSLLFGGQLSDRCLGIVASSKFCAKECEAGRGSCGVLSHGTKKFSLSKTLSM